MFVLKHNKLKQEIIISSYGKSTRGGWYASYHYVIGEDIYHDRFHANTLNELCIKAELSKTAMRRDVQRWDN